MSEKYRRIMDMPAGLSSSKPGEQSMRHLISQKYCHGGCRLANEPEQAMLCS